MITVYSIKSACFTFDAAKKRLNICYLFYIFELVQNIKSTLRYKKIWYVHINEKSSLLRNHTAELKILVFSYLY